MVHRMCKLPLSNYKKEYDHIINLAKINGYRAEETDHLIVKHANKIRRNNQSSLFRQNRNENEIRRVPMTYIPKVTDK